MDYRDGDGARSGVPGPGGTSNKAITTTRRTTTETRSGSIMGIISFAYKKIATHERSGGLEKR